MKVLILRTFAHTRIWEGILPCEFTNQIFSNKSMILNLEPNLINYNANEFSYAIGIYTHKYFTYVKQPSGITAYQGTQEENTISLLSLTNYPGSNTFSQATNDVLKISFNLVQKIGNSMDKMLLFDNEMIILKEVAIGNPAITKSVYSLCFSLEENVVSEKLKDIYDFNFFAPFG